MVKEMVKEMVVFLSLVVCTCLVDGASLAQPLAVLQRANSKLCGFIF